jgi:hypothetical protein
MPQPIRFIRAFITGKGETISVQYERLTLVQLGVDRVRFSRRLERMSRLAVVVDACHSSGEPNAGAEGGSLRDIDGEVLPWYATNWEPVSDASEAVLDAIVEWGPRVTRLI